MEKRFQLIALDRNGGRAVYTYKGKWFFVSIDNEWKSIILRDEKEIYSRAFQDFESQLEKEFASESDLIEFVRNEWFNRYSSKT